MRTSSTRASSLNFEGMVTASTLQMPPMVAAHLYPRLYSRPPTLPSKGDRFQSVVNVKAYEAAVISIRALNVTSMLSSYRDELCEDMAAKPDPNVWEITLLTDSGKVVLIADRKKPPK